MVKSLTTSEETVMQMMWKLGSGYLKDIIAIYPEPKPHQNTISTFVKNLVEKDFLKTEQEGRIFKYHVLISEEEYRKNILKNFLYNHYQGDANLLVLDLMKENLIQISLSPDKKKETKKKKKTKKKK